MDARLTADTTPGSATTALVEARALIALAAPLIVHNLANMGMQVTDTVLAGRLSAATLAGVAVGASLYTPVLMFALGLLMALSPTVAHLHGAGRERDIGAYTRQSLWISQAIGWSGFFLLRHAAPALDWFGIGAAAAGPAVAYLAAVAWALPAMCLFLVLRFTSEGISHTRPMLYISLFGLGCNAIADYGLIYGAWGLPRWGAYGCGIATSAVMWLMFFALLGYVMRARLYRPLTIFARFDWPRPAPLKELIWLGAPIAVSIFMEGSLFSAVALMMGALGTDVVAAHQIAVNFAALMFMVPMGVAMAISVRVGRARGQGDAAAARRSGLIGIGLCLVFMALSALAMTLFPRVIAAWYTDNARVQDIAVGLLGMAAIFQISDGLQVSGSGALRGYKDTRVPMWITVLAYWGIGFPLAWWLGVHLAHGPRAVWTGLIAGLSVSAALLNLRFWRISRIRKAPRTECLGLSED